jgi:hypothetical protein
MDEPSSKVILQVAERLAELEASLRAEPDNRRDRAADYFATVAACVRETAAELRKGTIPHGKCAEMEQHAKQLPGAIGDVIGV